MPWGTCLSWSCPWYSSECFRESFPTLERWQAPSVCGRLKTPWASILSPEARAAGTHPFVCHPKEGLAGRCLSRPLPCPAAWLPVLRRGRQAGAGGGGREPPSPSETCRPIPLLSGATPWGAARRGSQLSGAPGDLLPLGPLAVGLALVWTREGRGLGVLSSRCYTWAAPCDCASSLVHLFVSWNSSVPHSFVGQHLMSGTRRPAKAH